MDNFFANQTQQNNPQNEPAREPGQGNRDPNGLYPYTQNPADDNPYRSPMAIEPAYAEGTDRDRIYDSLGGWLILPAIGLVVAPFLRVFFIFQDFTAVERIPNAMVGLQALLCVEALGNMILLAWGIWAAIVFFSKKSSAPRAMIILFAGNMLLALTEAIIVASIANVNNELSTQVLTDLFRAVVIGGIWIAYFSVSKRVKGTFIR